MVQSNYDTDNTVGDSHGWCVGYHRSTAQIVMLLWQLPVMHGHSVMTAYLKLAVTTTAVNFCLNKRIVNLVYKDVTE